MLYYRFLQTAVRIKNYTGCVTKIRTNRIIFFKQNVFNEKLNITKNPFTRYLGDSGRAQLFDVSPINLNDDLYSLKRLHARYNIALCMLTNAASIAVLNDVTLGCRDFVCDFFNYAPYVLV